MRVCRGVSVGQAEFFLLLAFGVLFVVGTWFLHRANDEERIRRFIRSHGGRVISIQAVERISGLVSMQDSRVYAVRYLDRQDVMHDARCNTSGWLGVFVADDRTPPTTSRPITLESLQEENRRLREENETLKRRLCEKDSTAIRES